ncbi:GntR family transcriptional regulator [Neorhizobium sp. P12A]|uniref:GntR family transcriptional regulator n=1 Tax=Neorhizobium sp. P12A TaxID=2268027 RepID=UPI00165E0E2D|nr:GntR family transcriptional regulator [Neorhizobium sp. P12A]
MKRLTDIAVLMRDDIAGGRLELGARITIDDLASRYGASHMPVREALRRLLGEGLIEKQRGQGTRVRRMDIDFVQNLFETRNAIETVLARAAARHCTADDVARLTEIEDIRIAHVDARDYASALQVNHEFHQAINAIGRNPEANAILEQTWVLVAALWHRYEYGPERFAGVASDHKNLIRSLRMHDGEGAAVIAGAHGVKAKYDLLSRINPDPPPTARTTQNND